MSGLRRAMRIIAVLWIMSFISAVPFGMYSEINYLYYPPGMDQHFLVHHFSSISFNNVEQPTTFDKV